MAFWTTFLSNARIWLAQHPWASSGLYGCATAFGLPAAGLTSAANGDFTGLFVTIMNLVDNYGVSGTTHTNPPSVNPNPSTTPTTPTQEGFTLAVDKKDNVANQTVNFTLSGYDTSYQFFISGTPSAYGTSHSGSPFAYFLSPQSPLGGALLAEGSIEVYAVDASGVESNTVTLTR